MPENKDIDPSEISTEEEESDDEAPAQHHAGPEDFVDVGGDGMMQAAGGLAPLPLGYWANAPVHTSHFKNGKPTFQEGKLHIPGVSEDKSQPKAPGSQQQGVSQNPQGEGAAAAPSLEVEGAAAAPSLEGGVAAAAEARNPEEGGAAAGTRYLSEESTEELKNLSEEREVVLERLKTHLFRAIAHLEQAGSIARYIQENAVVKNEEYLTEVMDGLTRHLDKLTPIIQSFIPLLFPGVVSGTSSTVLSASGYNEQANTESGAHFSSKPAGQNNSEKGSSAYNRCISEEKSLIGVQQTATTEESTSGLLTSSSDLQIGQVDPGSSQCTSGNISPISTDASASFSNDAESKVRALSKEVSSDSNPAPSEEVSSDSNPAPSEKVSSDSNAAPPEDASPDASEA